MKQKLLTVAVFTALGVTACNNYQHAGDYSSNIDPALKTRLTPLVNKFKAGVGYLSGVPVLN